jgi:hypothetical protein
MIGVGSGRRRLGNFAPAAGFFARSERVSDPVRTNDATGVGMEIASAICDFDL